MDTIEDSQSTHPPEARLKAAKHVQEQLEEDKVFEVKARLANSDGVRLLQRATAVLNAGREMELLVKRVKERKRAERDEAMKSRALRPCCRLRDRHHGTKIEESHPGHSLITTPWMTPTEPTIIPADRYQGVAFRTGSLEPRYLGPTSRIAFHKVDLRNKHVAKVLASSPKEYLRNSRGLYSNQVASINRASSRRLS